MQYVETKDRLSISSIYYIGKLSTPLNGNDTHYANTSQNDGAIDGLNQTWVDSNGLPHTPHTSHQGGRGCHWELQQLYIDHLLIQKHHSLFEQCWGPDVLIWNKVIYDFVFSVSIMLIVVQRCQYVACLNMEGIMWILSYWCCCVLGHTWVIAAWLLTTF